MKTFNQALFELYQTSQITFDEAMARTTDPEDLKRTFQRAVANQQIPGQQPNAQQLAHGRRSKAGRNV